jgi:plasmid stabilization system protein ParE
VIPVVLRPQAIEDLREARRYYEEERAGLGDELRDALDITFERLQAFPRSAPPVAGFPGVRRALLPGFPYAVFYLGTSNRIVVLRVVHTVRDPEGWPSGEDTPPVPKK